jgi:hypothetical protein
MALAVACSTSPRPVVFEGNAPATADGLYRVQTRQVGVAYVKPGADFAAYDKVRVAPVTVSYKGGFTLDPERKKRLQGIFQDAFARQLGRSEVFTVVDAPGPRTLRVAGHIVDLLVSIPPRSTPGGEFDYIMDAGAMTLVLDVRDSVSGEPLARVADRRAIRPTAAGAQRLYRSTPVNNWGAVRDLASNWARVLRNGLDDLHALAVPREPDPSGAR